MTASISDYSSSSSSSGEDSDYVLNLNQKQHLKTLAELEKELREVQQTRSGSIASVAALLGDDTQDDFWADREQRLKDDIEILRYGTPQEKADYYKRRNAMILNPNLPPKPQTRRPRAVLTAEQQAKSIEAFRRDLDALSNSNSKGIQSSRPDRDPRTGRFVRSK